MDSVPITQVQDMPRLGYTKEEATKLVPCSLSHLNRAMEAGHLRFVRHGKKVIIPAGSSGQRNDSRSVAVFG